MNQDAPRKCAFPFQFKGNESLTNKQACTHNECSRKRKKIL